MEWIGAREKGVTDRAGAEQALQELYTVLGLQPPQTIVWLDSPFQGLLADAILHHQHGDALFRGDEPRIYMELMLGKSRWTWTLDGSPFPDPVWKKVPAGKRLTSRADVTKDALRQYATKVREKGPPLRDLQPLLERLPGSWNLEEVEKKLPQWLATLFAPTDNHRVVLPRAFRFDYKIAAGDRYLLNSPRCMDLDDIAATVYAVENLSKNLPDWFAPLRDLTAGAGWAWPYDEIALLCPLPKWSSYDESHALHCPDGPAVEFPEGVAIHALHGVWVKPEATNLSAITPEVVENEPDLKKKRLLLEQLGPEILDDPQWPEPLKQLSRMIYQRQYVRFTPDALSTHFAPWPPCVAEPGMKTAADPSAPVPQDGMYYSTYPCGQLRVIAEIKGGENHRWLLLGEGVAEGYLMENGPFAEQYYPDGRIEGFSPYDDTSTPDFTDMPFSAWVVRAINSFVPQGVTASDPFPAPDPISAPISAPAPDPAPAPAPPPECSLPSSPVSQPTLEELLPSLANHSDLYFSTRWNLWRLLKQELNLPDQLVHDLGCFGVAACRRLLTPPERRSDEVYLRPRWDRPERPTELVPLEQVELYRRVREAAQQELARAQKYDKTPFWVEKLAEPSPVVIDLELEKEGTLPIPIEWRPADQPLDPFWVCQVACQLMLRQEVTRNTQLGKYLRSVDPEPFYQAAGLAGAFLQSSAVLFEGLPNPALSPPGRGLEDLEELIAHLRTQPLLPPLRGRSFPSRGPFLHSLGAWVHRRATGSEPDAEQMVVLSRLGSFFNLRGGNFPSQLRALLSGEEAWELSYPVQGWPQPVQGELDDPGWSSLEDLVRARALQFLEQAGLSLWSDEKLVNNLSQRVFTAFCNLASDGQSSPHSELTARLQEPPPSPHFPRAGEGYLRLLEAARWALEPWRKGDEKLALALAHHLLGLF